MMPRSLLFRLILFIFLLFIGAWSVATFAAWHEGREYIDEFYDTQQMLFAKRIAAADLKSVLPHLPASDKLLDGAEGGEEEEDALGFAIFDRQGNLLLSDGEFGKNIDFDHGALGFRNMQIDPEDDDEWRVLWLDSLGGSFRVVVGQELDYRLDMSLDLLENQLAPWLIALPIMLIGVLWLVYRELRPLREVTRNLNKRNPGDTVELATTKLPSEVVPLVKALNSLFTRIASMLNRERAFISDAAHELRTPLAALRIQAEVAAHKNADEKMREKALNNLVTGIDRTSRLTEQLLELSRLEALGQQGKNTKTGTCFANLDWQELLKEIEQEFAEKLAAKSLNLNSKVEPLPQQTGQPELIRLLLRNLFENAVKYTPMSGNVNVLLSSKQLCIENSGPGVEEEFLSRLGERFFRPPGQLETGSGLGLSIVQRVAEIHGLKVTVENIKSAAQPSCNDGFRVRILF